MPEVSDELLKKARDARANAARSRRLAHLQADEERLALMNYADEQEAAASKLEQQAFNTPPAREHSQQEQMQQGQGMSGRDDESDS